MCDVACNSQSEFPTTTAAAATKKLNQPLFMCDVAKWQTVQQKLQRCQKLPTNTNKPARTAAAQRTNQPAPNHQRNNSININSVSELDPKQSLILKPAPSSICFRF
jgi:hypothetical protein